MKNRGKMSRNSSRKQFKRGDKTHVKNVLAAPARGGIRL